MDQPPSFQNSSRVFLNPVKLSGENSAWCKRPSVNSGQPSLSPGSSSSLLYCGDLHMVPPSCVIPSAWNQCPFNLLYPYLNSTHILQTSLIKCHLFQRTFLFPLSAIENYFGLLNHKLHFGIPRNDKL